MLSGVKCHLQSVQRFLKTIFLRTRPERVFENFFNTPILWKRLRVRGYPFKLLLPLFRNIRYSDRKRWLPQAPKKTGGLGLIRLLPLRPLLTAVTLVSRM